MRKLASHEVVSFGRNPDFEKVEKAQINFPLGVDTSRKTDYDSLVSTEVPWDDERDQWYAERYGGKEEGM